MAVSKGLGEIQQENLLVKASALGNWVAFFPYCNQPEQITFIQRIIEIIEENLDKEELGPTFLAERMHISPRQFSRKFKDLSGITPSDFIRNTVWKRLLQLLLETDYVYSGGNRSIGISSRPYFYKEFADKYGTTPKNYRAHHKAGTLTESES